ncbi:MAG: Bax inhibitor-1/YccA family protein [Chloroflexota bacterium]
MSYEYHQGELYVSENQISEIFTAAMQRVYLWMAVGLLLTAAVAYYVSNSQTLLSLIFSSQFTFFGLILLELGLVFGISRAINRLSPAAAVALFLLYAAINGLTLSAIFLAYSFGTITLAFGTTAVVFGIMSIVGWTTKQDLTKWGGILFMGLIGLIVASIANYFLASSTLDWIITYAGIIIFMGLTIYDTKRIKMMAQDAAIQGAGAATISRIGVLGALSLYLDFINLFLFLLRLLGRRD